MSIDTARKSAAQECVRYICLTAALPMDVFSVVATISILQGQANHLPHFVAVVYTRCYPRIRATSCQVATRTGAARHHPLRHSLHRGHPLDLGRRTCRARVAAALDSRRRLLYGAAGL